MKNKNLLLIYSLCVPFFLASCKKNNLNSEPQPIEPNCSISNISFSKGSNVSYEYDRLGRIIKYAGYRMTYNAGSVIFSYGNISEVINLDSKGNAVSRTSKQNFSTSEEFVTINRNTSYIYNADGYLINELETKITNIASRNPSTDTIIIEHIYEYENGNINTYTLDNNGTKTIWKYTYYSTLLNQLAEFQLKLDFKGKKNKNLVKTTEEIKDGSIPIISNYTYQMDNKGKLNIESIESPQGKSETTYSWSCK